ncbi:MAG: exo-alpha-sialidase, partial [Frankiales bacterium]|nr:exo-alpha-sialidase [Frankiales bacterium]
MSRRVTCLVSAGALLAAGSVSAVAATRPAAAPVPAWSSSQKLGHWAGGEPSVAFDPTGNGSVYIAAPQSIPTGANLVLGGAATKGIGFWASHDHGRTFPLSSDIGSAVGGGDSDVDVAKDH